MRAAAEQSAPAGAMATLAESFMADLADLSDDSASEDEAPQQQQLDGNDLLVSVPALVPATSA